MLLRDRLVVTSVFANLALIHRQRPYTRPDAPLVVSPVLATAQPLPSAAMQD